MRIKVEPCPAAAGRLEPAAADRCWGVLVDAAAITVFSLAVFYYAVHSRLSPARVAANVSDAVADAGQDELALEVEPA